MARTLVLVPTAREREALGQHVSETAGVTVALSGVGPVAAAARTAGLIATVEPIRVLLAGIAGTHDPVAFPLGEALAFGAVALDGLGAGRDGTFIALSEMGLAQWPGDAGTDRIDDRLPLDLHGERDGGLLLTCAAASADAGQAADRRTRRSGLRAEDMEAFGVALAGALARVPVTVVRGASNRAGDRDLAHWQVGPALEAAGRVVDRILSRCAEAGR